MIEIYMKEDVQKFEEKYRGKNRQPPDDQAEFFTPRNVFITNNAITEGDEKLNYFAERAKIKQFLQTQPGFEDCEP
jgi:hypothetical protein